MTPKAALKNPTDRTETNVKPKATPEPDQIASLAYALWQQRGCPDGSAEADWLRAEEELTTTR
jgi:Protein of unknown function (DUF2934)